MNKNIVIDLTNKYFDKEDLYKTISKYDISEKDFKEYINLIKFHEINPIKIYRLISYKYPRLTIRNWERFVKRYNLIYKASPIRKLETINIMFFEDKDHDYLSKNFVVKNAENQITNNI